MCSSVPLVFSTFGRMSGCTHFVYKHLAYLLSLKGYSLLQCCGMVTLYSVIDSLREVYASIVAAQSAIGVLILP